MLKITSDQKKLLIEIFVVLGVFFLGRFLLQAADISLSGPLGTIAALGVIYFLFIRDKKSFLPLGLKRPENFWLAGVTVIVAVGLTVIIGTIGLEYIRDFTNYVPTEESGRFDYLKGDLTALIISIIGIAWFAAAFGEEVLFRGFLLSRLSGLFGPTKTSLVFIVLLQALFFALLHGSILANQIIAGLIALVYGTLYLTLSKRCLWPLIIAHAIPDTISFLQIYSS